MKQSVSLIDFKVIRPADRRRIFELLELMHSEQGIAELAPFSASKVEAMIDHVLKCGLVAIALEDGEIVGTLGVVPEAWWFTEALHWGEKWTFVHPAHRHGASRHAANLLELCKAIERTPVGPDGLRYIMVTSVLSRHRTAGKCRLFARHFKPAGQIFMGQV